MKRLLLLLTLLIPAFASAGNPSVTNVTYGPVYINQATVFTINIVPADTNGVIRCANTGTPCVDTNTGLSSTPFNQSTSSVTFSLSWNVNQQQNPKFYFDNLIDVNTGFFPAGNNASDDFVDTNFFVKRPFDVIVADFNMSTPTLQPNIQTTFNFRISNIGDDNYNAIIPVDVVVDGNVVCSSNLDLNNLTGSCAWTPVSFNSNSHSVSAIVNRLGAISEFTTTNNSMTLSSVGTSLPDLTINNIILPTQLRRGELNNLGILIGNIGQGAAQSSLLNVYLTFNGATTLISSTQTDVIGANSTKGVPLPYLFQTAGDYNISVKINENQLTTETNYANNTNSIAFVVQDFNINQLIRENDAYRIQVIELQGKLDVSKAETQSCQQDVLNKTGEISSCQSNLNICNTNNSTKIANWMKDLDANKDAEFAIFEMKYNDLLNEKNADQNTCDIEKLGLIDEKNQWSMLVIAGLLALVGFIAFNEIQKAKPKKDFGSQ